MNEKVKKHNMTSTELLIISMQTCQWWNMVFIQSDRFFNVLNSNHGGTPWENEENNSLFVADRLFLIITIYYAVENLQKLNIELQRTNDNSLKNILEDIENIVSWEKLKNLRDMNVHNLDYLIKNGQKMEKFYDTIEIGNTKTITTAAWTAIDLDENTIILGNVRLKELLHTMKLHLPFVREKTKQIYNKTLYG